MAGDRARNITSLIDDLNALRAGTLGRLITRGTINKQPADGPRRFFYRARTQPTAHGPCGEVRATSPRAPAQPLSREESGFLNNDPLEGYRQAPEGSTPLRDLTPNPLSQEGEGAKKTYFMSFPLDPSPLSLLGEGVGGEVSQGGSILRGTVLSPPTGRCFGMLTVMP